MAVIKGVVLERRENGAVILTRSGRFRFVRLKKHLPDVGTEIQHREWGQDVLWYGAAVALLFFLMFQVAAFMTPAVYVIVQEKPGIELGINRFGLVVKASAIDESGTRLLEEIPVKGRKAESALKEMMSEAVSKGDPQSRGHKVKVIVAPANETGEKLLDSIVPLLERIIKEGTMEGESPDMLLEVHPKTAPR